MYCKTLKLLKKETLAIVILLFAFYAGCASNKVAERKNKDIKKSHNLKIITNITTLKDSQSVQVHIKGNRLLTYTSVKQPFPLSIILYFPDTALDKIKNSYSHDSNLISSIQTNELTEKGHTSKIQIFLKKDIVYEVIRQGNGINIIFNTQSTALISEKKETRTDDSINKTSINIPEATLLKKIEYTKLLNGVNINAKANGTIKNFKSFTIKNIARVVIDLFGIQSPFNKKEQYLQVNTKWVKTVRYVALHDRIRILVDTQKPYLSSFSIDPVKDGLLINVTGKVNLKSSTDITDLSLPKTRSTVNQKKEQINSAETSWINQIDFSSENTGKSTIIVGTTSPVKYNITKASNNILHLNLYNTKLPYYRRYPLITTRFESAVDRITPIQTDTAVNNTTKIVIEMRESVPYFVKKKDKSIMIHFEASSTPPKPYEKANLPLWEKVIDQAALYLEEEILPDAAEEKGVVKEINPNTLKKESKTKYTGEKIALDFYETDVKNVFRILMEVSGKNFAIDHDVQGKVTLKLDTPVPYDQVLELILNMNQLGQVSEDHIVRIARSETLAKEKSSKQKEVKTDLKEEVERKAYEPLVTKYLPINYRLASEISDKLETTDRGSVKVDTQTNQIIVKDIQTSINEIEKVVKQLDMIIQQVLIEARIVEASTSFTRHLGTSWGITGGPLSSNQLGRLGGDFSYNMAANNLPDVSQGSIGFSFDRLSGTPFSIINATLQAAESEGKIKILSAPKILTLDNMPATIKKGKSYPINKLDADGNSTTTFKDIDLLLDVTPHVTNDNRVKLKIKVTKNDLGEKVGSDYIFTNNEAETELLVNDGETIVIGGILKSTTTSTVTGVPLFSQIPILGWLFKSKSDIDSQEELLVFITPKIIRVNKHISKLQ